MGLKGSCPQCGRETTFRRQELNFKINTDDVKSLFKDIGRWVEGGGQQFKKEIVAELGLLTGKTKLSMNYVCDSCDDFVTQCPVCYTILKYATIDCPNCGTTLSSL